MAKNNNKNSRDICENCGHLVDGSFCRYCGQAPGKRIPAVGEIVGEFLSGLYNLDSRIWQSFSGLFRPAYLTREYFAGRRVRYIPPFRLYLICSVLFFLLNALQFDYALAPDVTIRPQDDGTASTMTQEEFTACLQQQNELEDGIVQELSAQCRDIMNELEDTPGLDVLLLQADPDTCREELITPTASEEFNRLLVTACERILGNPENALNNFLNQIPLLVFLVIPLTALALKFLYALRGRYYVEHLFFLFHVQAYFFLTLFMLILISVIQFFVPPFQPVATVLSATAWIYFMVYVYLAMQRFYRQGYTLTAVKYILLGLLYFLTTAVVFIFGFFYTVLAG